MTNLFTKTTLNTSDKPIALSFHNENNSYSFFQIVSPFQITYEFASGIGKNDYFNSFIISPDDVFSYCTTMQERLAYDTKRSLHSHDFFELMIVLEGTTLQIIENNEYLYPEGSCCLINRSLLHTEKFLGRTKLIFIGLSTNLALELIQTPEHAYFSDEKSVLNNSVFDFITSDLTIGNQKAYIDFMPKIHQNTEQNLLYQYSEQLISTVLSPHFGSSYLLKGLFCQLFQYLTDNYHSTYIELDSHTDFLLYSRARYLVESSNGRISREALSEFLHYSSGHIARTIKKYTGMCLYDYEMSFCLKKAAELLSTTNKSILDIMDYLHFTNRTHFYKLFKEKYGIVPGEYRLQHKNLKDLT